MWTRRGWSCLPWERVTSALANHRSRLRASSANGDLIATPQKSTHRIHKDHPQCSLPHADAAPSASRHPHLPHPTQYPRSSSPRSRPAPPAEASQQPRHASRRSAPRHSLSRQASHLRSLHRLRAPERPACKPCRRYRSQAPSASSPWRFRPTSTSTRTQRCPAQPSQCRTPETRNRGRCGVRSLPIVTLDTH